LRVIPFSSLREPFPGSSLLRSASRMGLTVATCWRRPHSSSV
jgi:hypothetical protein